MTQTFEDLYPDAPLPKTAWRWTESAQYRLLRHGAHRALSAVDLHDDGNFATVAQYLPDLRERTI